MKYKRKEAVFRQCFCIVPNENVMSSWQAQSKSRLKSWQVI